jgi:DNA-binding MarR family transcriptional regulator
LPEATIYGNIAQNNARKGEKLRKSAAGGPGARIQPVLHKTNRRASGGVASKRLLVDRTANHVRASRENTTASELAELLGINHGYLSRILKRFKSLGFIERKRSPADGRQLLLTLTSKGRQAYTPLDARASAEVESLLKDLSREDVRKLLEAMDTIRKVLTRREFPVGN